MSVYGDSTYKEKPKRYTNEGELADFGSRLVAIFIDGFILAILFGILFGGGGRAGGILWALVGVAYQWYFLTQQNGQTPGKMLMGIRVVKVTGEPLTAADAIIRYIGYFVNNLVFGLPIGFLWVLFDRDSQGWHDKLARTYVIRSR